MAKPASDALKSHRIDDIRPKSSRSSFRHLIRSSFKPALVVLALILAAGLGAAISHLSFNNNKLTGLPELHAVEAKVSRHYLLPTNEVPALATVTNQSKLTTPFLKNARNGDEILIYQNNKIAIVYRPSIDRIISVGPVNITPLGQTTPK